MADSDPVKRLERELEDQERAITAHLQSLKQEINELKNPAPPAPQQTVWRAPAASSDARRVELEAARRAERTHSAQRRRDRARFILLALVLLIVVIWLIRVL